MSDVLANLNPAQKEAVTHTDGPLLIVAGAGSGKTRVLTHRIAYIIESKKADADEILAVTFTNKAAKEMKERIARLLGTKAKQPLVGTFHAISVRFLRRYAGLLGYPNAFVIYDTADQLSLMKTILKEKGLSEKQFHPQAVLHQISNAKNELINAIAYQKLASGFFQETAAELYVNYQDRLKSASAMDFDDLIGNTVGLFEQHPGVLASLQERFKYLLVDEYQDTNHAQYRWISLLAEKRHNLAVVGDPDQGIYSWRGATIRNIMEFEAQNPGAEVINLEQNYRSTPQILGAADAVIENNTQRKPKSLFTENKEGERVSVVEHASADE
jgi:DNA helicase II / ATP-dependent DNA helicase PcrA